MSVATHPASFATRVRTIYRESWDLFRHHFGFIVGSAACILLPFAILDGLGLLVVDVGGHSLVVGLLLVVVTTATAGLSGLAAIFYAGVLDHTVAAWIDDTTAPTRRSVAGRLPWGQLVLASVLGFVVEVIGVALFVVPGLILATLLILTGPVLVGEHLRAVPAMRRSAQLVRRAPVLVVVAVAIPMFVEASLADLAGLVLGHEIVAELLIETVVTLFAASFVGVLEVATAHYLRDAYPPDPSEPVRAPEIL
ncbi:MAG: hypothetical protein ABJC79_03700 [Acidimicrobiia bacterium]